ncbi:MAG: carboxy terminal-processing peptidase [Succinivibrionaceae bacterium]|nr:carboxy terminal-processing peptidase [Succinivibrionaceae bacterium]
MRKSLGLLIKSGLAAALYCALSSGALAENKLTVPTAGDIPALKPEPQQMVACRRIYGYFTRAHYKETDLNAAFIDKVYDAYFRILDFNRTLFTAAEAQEIRQSAPQMKISLSTCALDYPFSLYRKFADRRFEKFSYFIKRLNAPFNLEGQETLYIDSSNMPLPADRASLEKLWSSYVENDYIRLRLMDKSDEESRKLLKKRYENSLRLIVQTKNEDAFSYFENAFARAIDPHTSYLSPADTSNFNDDMNLSLEGIGAVLTQDEDYVQIVSIIPGSPAELSRKLKAKDRIIGVQQHESAKDEMLDVVGMRLIDVVPKIKGKKGSKVTLLIQRGDGANAQTFKVDLIRDKIRLEERAAKGKLNVVDGHKVGVLTVKSFYMNLHADMQKEIQALTAQGMEALVVDLRNNGGGSLEEAILSSGLFFKSGPVVQVRDATGQVIGRSDTDGVSYYDGPLVVLINRYSASSSEIFSGALQDWGRAIIVGDRSFGKGTVQQGRPLERIYDYFDKPLGSIHYTIGKFYRISGDSNQLLGVLPDVRLYDLNDEKTDTEGEEPNALPWDRIKGADYKPVANLKPFVPALQEAHQERVKHDALYNDVVAELFDYQTLRKGNELELNLEHRKAKSDQTKAKHLELVNKLLALDGKPPVKDADDLPDNYEAPDLLLRETERIALDLAAQMKK